MIRMCAECGAAVGAPHEAGCPLTDKEPRVVLRSCGATDQPVPDSWAHRSRGMRCRTCMWFVEKRADEGGIAVPDKIVGRCRRHAPTMSGFPVVFVHDWCGDHKLDEGRV